MYFADNEVLPLTWQASFALHLLAKGCCLVLTGPVCLPFPDSPLVKHTPPEHTCPRRPFAQLPRNPLGHLILPAPFKGDTGASNYGGDPGAKAPGAVLRSTTL